MNQWHSEISRWGYMFVDFTSSKNYCYPKLRLNNITDQFLLGNSLFFRLIKNDSVWNFFSSDMTKIKKISLK